MKHSANSEFAELLDDLMAAAAVAEPSDAAPSIPVDLLIDPQGVRRSMPAPATAEYFDALDILDEIRAMPSVDPADIAGELSLSTLTDARDLDRIRREFAFQNHPDRVPDDRRDRAMLRMQVANQLIDEAKRRLEGAA